MKIKPMFYVADVNGAQIEAYDFTTYGPAAKRARTISRATGKPFYQDK